MNKQHLRWWLGLGLVNFLAATAMGAYPNYPSVQSALRISGWTLYDRVQAEVTASDPLALDFQNNLSTLLNATNTSLKEGAAYAAATNAKLDPQRLYFFADYAPRIYFISNGGWYTDALGVTIGPASAPNGQAPQGTKYLVFPSMNSCYTNTCSTKQTHGSRTTLVPLLPGDFVQLPTVRTGQQMALAFMSNLSTSGGTQQAPTTGTPQYTFYNDPTANPDGTQHIIAFFPNSSRYFIVGFEDQYGGGDGDFNDNIIVIDVGATNASLWRNGGLPK